MGQRRHDPKREGGVILLEVTRSDGSDLVTCGFGPLFECSDGVRGYLFFLLPTHDYYGTLTGRW